MTGIHATNEEAVWMREVSGYDNKPVEIVQRCAVAASHTLTAVSIAKLPWKHLREEPNLTV